MSIKKMTTDLSPIVRRAAATASERCFRYTLAAFRNDTRIFLSLNRLDSGLKETLKEILGPLLKEDPAPSVIGAAMTAFNAIFLHNSSLLSEGMELLDSAYFHIIQSLSGMDDWGRIEVLYGLTRYARTRFTDPLKLETPLHPDHRFLLDSCIPLLSSLNFGV